MVEKESYLLELCRYTVRAKVVNYPWEWKWSSYLATAGIAKAPKFLTIDWILSQFGKNRKRAQKAYKEFVMSGIEKEAPWKDLKGRIILGKEGFLEKIKGFLKTKEEIKEIPRIERFVIRPKPTQVFSGVKDKKERDKNIYIAHIKKNKRGLSPFILFIK